MTRIEVTEFVAAPPAEVMGFVADFNSWPRFQTGLTGIIEPENGAWSAPGDQVRFSYSLLGRRLEGTGTIEETEPGRFLRSTTRVAGYPDLHEQWTYAAEDGGCRLTVVYEGDESSGLFGRLLDRVLIPRTLERNLKRSLSTLKRLIADRASTKGA